MSKRKPWDSPYGPGRPHNQKKEEDEEMAIIDDKTMSNLLHQSIFEMLQKDSSIFSFSPSAFDFDRGSEIHTSTIRTVNVVRPNEAIRNKVKDLIIQTSHTVQWDDVVGNEAARVALIQAVESATTEKDLYAFYGMKATRGVLLYGSPGCGKTMFAKAAAARLAELHGGAAEMIVMSASAIQSPYIGVTEAKIKAVFDYAREYRRCYKRDLPIFIDEAETLFPNRQMQRTGEWQQANIAAVLEGLDGIESCGAFVMLATNLPERLDPALLRDGRVDRKIKIERPNLTDAAEIILRSLKDAPLGDGVKVGELARFAAMQLYRSDLILQDFTAFRIATGEETALHFTLADIVSGAMAAGMVNKAKTIAFERDLRAKTRSGIGKADFAAAAEMLLAENKDIAHNYAMREFFEKNRKNLDQQAVNQAGAPRLN